MALSQTENKKQINRLGFGAWQLGNTDFWGYMSTDDGIKLVKQAIKFGITFFDTAPGYAYGLSESIIGAAMVGHRESVFINTKLGHKASGETDFSAGSFREQIEESLERLNTTYIDSVLLHNPSIEILQGKTDHFEELEAIKQDGLIRHYGVSIDTYEEFETVIKLDSIDVIEVLFNVFYQDIKPLLKKAKEKGILLIAKVPLDSGWLTGKYNETSEFSGIRSRWDDETILRRAKLVKKLKRMTKASNLTPYALGFILSFEEIDVVIPGTKNEEQLKQNLSYASFELSKELKTKFEALYDKEIKNNPLPW